MLTRHCLNPLMFAASLVALSGCWAVPYPWFPSDPHAERLERLASQEIVTRDEVLRTFGQPWAALEDDHFVYITDKPSSRIIYGFLDAGDEGPLTWRDFILVFDFDDDGVMTQFDTYRDTGDHTYCFANGICFEPLSKNTPLAPRKLDARAKEIQPTPGLCTAYLYRDDVTQGRSYKGYVDIKLGESNNYQNYPASAAASMPGGFFQWHLKPGQKYRLIADFKEPKSYPFFIPSISNREEGKKVREEVRLDFICGAGKIIYFRLAVPKNKKGVPELHMTEAGVAQPQIRQLRLLMGRYRPDMIFKAESRR